MNNEEFINLAAAAVCIYLKKKKKPRKQWEKEWFSARNKLTHVRLLEHLTLEPADWRNYLRMDEATYHVLLEMVTPIIQRQDTNMRQAITPHERLSATLRYLASGCSYEELKFTTAISPQSLGRIIPDTCRAILHCLRDFMKMPNTVEEWTKIAKDFEERWNFPHCLGAVDGKHVRIVPPPGSGSYFYNYKQFHSVVLMACANANYEFIWVESGTNGRVSDGGVLKNTEFFKELNAGELNLPPPQPLSGHANSYAPFVFVGDEAFALRTDFMKPFSQKSLNKRRRIFNYRLSRARRIVENAFGIMASRFRVFHHSINLTIDRVDLVVLTCCILHNFLRKTCSSYNEEGMEPEDDIATSDRIHIPSLQYSTDRNASTSAKLVRETFAEYFEGDGQVPWQDSKI